MIERVLALPELSSNIIYTQYQLISFLFKQAYDVAAFYSKVVKQKH